MLAILFVALIAAVHAGSGLPPCTAAQALACLSATIPTCAAGIKPTRDPTSCCPTCLPTALQCSLIQLATCAINTPLLPICPRNVQPVFNTTTCCQTCRRDGSLVAAAEGRPDNKGKCTLAQFTSCVAGTPVCESGQRPIRSNLTCCPTCTRPERQCSPAAVVACRALSRTCSVGETPTYFTDECCPSCRPPPPVCTPACNSSKVCVSDRNGDATCRFPGRRLRLYFKKTIDTIPSCFRMIEVLQEVVNRFCDKSDNATLCDDIGVRDDIAGLIRVACAHANANTTADLTLAIPSDTPASNRRRDASSNPATSESVLVMAIADSDATSGLSVSQSTDSTSGGSSSDNTPIIIGATIGGVAFVAIVVAAVLIIVKRKQTRLTTHPSVTGGIGGDVVRESPFQ